MGVRENIDTKIDNYNVGLDSDRYPNSWCNPVAFYGLWILALLTYGIGDTVSTIFLIEMAPDVREANILIQTAAEMYGQPGIAGVKVAVFLICLGISLSATRNKFDPVLHYAPMALLTIIGTSATAFNIFLLSS